LDWKEESHVGLYDCSRVWMASLQDELLVVILFSWLFAVL
jgi:hypothetical protein